MVVSCLAVRELSLVKWLNNSVVTVCIVNAVGEPLELFVADTPDLGEYSPG